MTTRTFWLIVIKIAAIWFFIQSFGFIQGLVSVIYLNNSANVNVKLLVYDSISAFLPIFITAVVLWLAFVKTEWLINKLKLENGIDEKDITLNLHRSSVLTIVVIVIGGLTFIDALPILCLQVFDYYKQTKLLDASFDQHPNAVYILIYAVKTIIGYLLMTNSRLFVNLIELRRRKSLKKNG